MVGNVYDYARANVFDAGAFLIGAAHKNGIVKAIGKFTAAEPDLITWSYTYVHTP
jgi:hypothetical protein